MSVQTHEADQHSRTVRRVLIAGAGMGAIETLLALRHLAGDRVRVDLLAATHDFVYRPLGIVEPFGHGSREHRMPLNAIAREHGAGHVFDDLESVDAGARRVRGTSGDEFGYDALVVATGARPIEAVEGSVVFRGSAGIAAYRQVLDGLAEARVRKLAFVVPPGPVWPLPAYELALMTHAWAWERSLAPAQLTLVSPEPRPLAVFGEQASAAVAELLRRRGVEFYGDSRALDYTDGALHLNDGNALPADAVVSVPRLGGPAFDGLPADADGFIPVDEHGRVVGCPNVFAVGDGAGWPVKFGGLATQQADAVAEEIASWAGAPVRPSPFQPVLRGLLLAGNDRLYLRADSRAGRTRSAARATPLWWPPAKVAGKYVAPYMAAHGIHVPDYPTSPSPAGAT